MTGVCTNNGCRCKGCRDVRERSLPTIWTLPRFHDASKACSDIFDESDSPCPTRSPSDFRKSIAA